MSIKKWEVDVDYLFGLHTKVIVKANTQRKAEIIAMNKVKKEKKCSIVFIGSCKLITEDKMPVREE